MSGIYIPGVKLPEHCNPNECLLCMLASGDVFYCRRPEGLIPVGDLTHQENSPSVNGCPVLFIKNHGDLVDRSDLFERLLKSRYDNPHVVARIRADHYYEHDHFIKLLFDGEVVIPEDTEERTL